MTELFGIPVGSLLVGLAIALAAVVSVLAALALRNPVLVKLGVRNVRRRGGRTALIVLGLMLGTTIITAALATGDTMSHTVRATAVESLGATDVIVSAAGTGTDVPGELGDVSGFGYISQSVVREVEGALAGTGLADGVTGAIVDQVALQAPQQRRTEPRVTLFAPDPDRTDDVLSISDASGAQRSLGELRPGEAFLDEDAAEELGVAAGDRVLLFAGSQPSELVVADVVSFAGTGTTGSSLLLPLREAQTLLRRQGLIRHVLVSNTGDDMSGVGLSDAVAERLQPVADVLGLEVATTKQDALADADEAGNAFMAIFTTFGSFSIAAGILLIFLIFVMLAAERRGELGIARAIGTRRSHLVQLYTFEGLAYDLGAALVGALLGVAIAYGMVFALASAFATEELSVEFAVSARSLAIAYALGVLLTFVVVAVSAWRVSVMTISAAIRNLPEPASQRRRGRWILGLVGLSFGALLTASGLAGAAATPLMLGISLLIVSAVPFARLVGVPERAAFTIPGLAIIVLWLLPWSVWERAFGQLSMDFSTWIASGLMLVTGVVWVIMFNADLVIGIALRTVGRIRAAAPVLRIALAYPLAGRFRTGTTLAMFTLVVFTLVTGTTSSGSFMAAFQDTEAFGGGFHVRASTAPAAPIWNLQAAIDQAPGVDRERIVAVGSQSVLPVAAKQVGTERAAETYAVRGLDAGFLAHTTFELGAIARPYGSAREVWDAIRERPGLAVVDSLIVPRRDQFGFAPAVGDFRLTGFLYDDGVFEPVPVVVRDPDGGPPLRLTVIGVLSDTAPVEMMGISTSQETLAVAFPNRALPTIHYVALTPGADARVEAARLESAFLANGMEAEAVEDVLADVTASSVTINRLIQGFMGLGLIVGVAALGVVAARSVVERRQQIGVLRAIGFRRGMVQASFILEAALVAITAIVVGSALGLVLAFNIVRDQREQASWEGLSLVVPWLNLGIIFAAVFVVAVGTTLAPALRASRIRPAEALRYQ
jgi:putative ABC transport system permease protein